MIGIDLERVEAIARLVALSGEHVAIGGQGRCLALLDQHLKIGDRRVGDSRLLVVGGVTVVKLNILRHSVLAGHKGKNCGHRSLARIAWEPAPAAGPSWSGSGGEKRGNNCRGHKGVAWLVVHQASVSRSFVRPAAKVAECVGFQE